MKKVSVTTVILMTVGTINASLPSIYSWVGHEEMQEILHGGSEEEDEEYADVNTELMKLTPAISLNAIAGEFNPKTLRVTGYYKKEALKVLVDSGSTFNFI